MSPFPKLVDLHHSCTISTSPGFFSTGWMSGYLLGGRGVPSMWKGKEVKPAVGDEGAPQATPAYFSPRDLTPWGTRDCVALRMPRNEAKWTGAPFLSVPIDSRCCPGPICANRWGSERRKEEIVKCQMVGLAPVTSGIDVDSLGARVGC